jgi:hypothetical protein
MNKYTLNLTLLAAFLAILTQSANALPNGNIPEVASTSALLGVVMGGIVLARRFIRR